MSATVVGNFFYATQKAEALNSRLVIFCVGGDGGIRTLDPQIANLMLSQLSYVPSARDYNLCAVPCQEKFSCVELPNCRCFRNAL